jgi:hypothetical protein
MKGEYMLLLMLGMVTVAAMTISMYGAVHGIR